jgi:exosome complex component RRP41
MTEEKKYVNKQGKRLDGRKLDETRPIKITAGVLDRAEGSCYLEWGQNKILAGVFGPREALPAHTQNPKQARINVTYRMATFSVPDRKNPRPGRRDIEISKVLAEALSRAVFIEKFPNASIDVFVEVLDSNAGSRVACLTAASVALANAGILPNSQEIVLLQADGVITKEELNQALKLGIKACQNVYELQKKALIEKFEATAKDVK